MGKIKAISISENKGTRKNNVNKVNVIDQFGLENDAHAGKWHRQISFLAEESIQKIIDAGLNVKAGDFAENITTTGIDLCGLSVGSILQIGNLEFVISQMGKICHKRCAIYFQAGDCVMPKEGIFAVVKGDGEIKVGDEIKVVPKKNFSVAVITLSDKGSKGEREDITGIKISDFINDKINPAFIRYEMIPDEKDKLEKLIIDLTDRQQIDIIITNGSTGIAERDIAPDVTEKIITRRLPGFEEAMRMESFKITPHALISRAVCGTRKNSFIINLPGSPKGAIENLSTVVDAIPHCVKKLQGDKTDCAVN
jgi:molybdenum cofactor synthesis domain-containing protein